MKALTFGISLALAVLARAQENSVPPAPGTPDAGGLQRVEPRPGQARGKGTLEELFARDFDRDRWRARLTVPDLDQRERSFELLVQRARLDPVARAFLEELARDPKDAEAAWTARLALRELGRARFPLQGGFFGPDPAAGTLLGNGGRLQQWMNERFAQDGLALQFTPGARSSAGGRSVRVEQGEHGALVRITETINGAEHTRTYPGASLDEILRTNPGLREELGGLGLHTGGLTRPGSGGEVELAPQGLSRPTRTDRLGVVVVPLELERARALGLEREGKPYGLRVELVLPQTFASLLGVRAGDVLLELDGIRLATGEEIVPRMRQRAADEVLTLAWLDELGQRQTKSWRPAPPEPR